ncbi:hypothetical protein ARMGADRAFT_945130, partial [Armillaria gallica]
KNMAEAVWETLTLYGIHEKIFAFVMDNISNNDTMIKGIEHHCKKECIPFNARISHLWCMPHIVHLSAIKLLEAIGVISKNDAKKANGQTSNYQNAAMATLDRSYALRGPSHTG